MESAKIDLVVVPSPDAPAQRFYGAINGWERWLEKALGAPVLYTNGTVAFGDRLADG